MPLYQYWLDNGVKKFNSNLTFFAHLSTIFTRVKMILLFSQPRTKATHHQIYKSIYLTTLEIRDTYQTVLLSIPYTDASRPFCTSSIPHTL